MDIQFYGADCVTLTVQGVRVVVDDNLKELGAKSVARSGDIALFTGAHNSVVVDAKLIIDRPGEYEVSALSIYGIPARAHTDADGQTTATMYKLVYSDLSVLITGHIFPDLSDDELEEIGTIDALIIPVGGNGYTLDAVGALSLIKKIEPKLVIPTHYSDEFITYPVPQQTIEQSLKGLAMEPNQKLSKLKLKSSDLTDALQLVILERP